MKSCIFKGEGELVQDKDALQMIKGRPESLEFEVRGNRETDVSKIFDQFFGGVDGLVHRWLRTSCG